MPIATIVTFQCLKKDTKHVRMKPTQSLHLLSIEYSIDKHMAKVVYYHMDPNLLNNACRGSKTGGKCEK